MNYEEANDYFNKKITLGETCKLLNLIAEDKTIEGIEFVKKIAECDENIAKLLWGDLKCKYGSEETNPCFKQQEGYLCQADLEYVEKMKNKPKCPTCNSTNLKKISTTAKAVNTLAFGLLGTKRNKTFHCSNCGYEW